MKDIAIIGGGPAGLSAAIQARMRELSVTLVAREDAKSALSLAPLIENYPACPNVSGIQLLSMMKSHALGLGTEFHNGKVTSVLDMGGRWGLGVGNDFVEARIVMLATGAKQPKLLPGEAALIGRGLSYCATCDGMLYRGKRVAVLAQSAHAVSEANFLAELAGAVLYFGKPDPDLSPGIEVIDQRVSGLLEEEGQLTGLTVGDRDYALDGLFIERDQMALSTLMSGLEMRDAFIQVDRQMRTNLPGVFAIGDCTGGPLQVGKAVGDGVTAAYYAAQDLQQRGDPA